MLILNILLLKISLMLPIWLTALPLCVDKDVLAESLLSFGASSVSVDQDVSQITDEVNLLIFCYS